MAPLKPLLWLDIFSFLTCQPNTKDLLEDLLAPEPRTLERRRLSQSWMNLCRGGKGRICHPKICHRGVIIVNWRQVRKADTAQAPWLPSIYLNAEYKFLLRKYLPASEFMYQEGDSSLISRDELALRKSLHKQTLLTGPYLISPIYLPSHNWALLEAQSPFPWSYHFYAKLLNFTKILYKANSNHPFKLLITECIWRMPCE